MMARVAPEGPEAGRRYHALMPSTQELVPATGPASSATDPTPPTADPTPPAGRWSKLGRFAPAIVGVVSFAVYLRTLLPGLAFGDWGEMQTISHVLGVAHPTGYPTYVILGWIAQLVPIGSRRVPAQPAVGRPRGDRPRDLVRDRGPARRPTRAGGGQRARPRRGRHGLGGGHGRRGQPAPPPVLRAAHPPGARLGDAPAADRPRARRPARRTVAREPPPDAVRGPVRRPVRPVGRATRHPRPAVDAPARDRRSGSSGRPSTCTSRSRPPPRRPCPTTIRRRSTTSGGWSAAVSSATSSTSSPRRAQASSSPRSARCATSSSPAVRSSCRCSGRSGSGSWSYAGRRSA